MLRSDPTKDNARRQAGTVGEAAIQQKLHKDDTPHGARLRRYESLKALFADAGLHHDDYMRRCQRAARLAGV